MLGHHPQFARSGAFPLRCAATHREAQAESNFLAAAAEDRVVCGLHGLSWPTQLFSL